MEHPSLLSMQLPWHELTAFFGGSFDPPHLSHLQAVQGLFENPGVGRIGILPSGHPPLKNTSTSSLHRLKMVQLTFESLKDRVFIEDFEISKVSASHLRTYTYDTLQALGKKYDARKIAFTMGVDQLELWPQWHRFPEVLKLAHWIILARKPGGLEQGFQALSQLEASGLIRKKTTHDSGGTWEVTASERVLTLVETPAPSLSSTRIRETLEKTGEPPLHALPPRVVEYLKENQLYGTSKA